MARDGLANLLRFLQHGFCVARHDVVHEPQLECLLRREAVPLERNLPHGLCICHLCPDDESECMWPRSTEINLGGKPSRRCAE